MTIEKQRSIISITEELINDFNGLVQEINPVLDENAPIDREQIHNHFSLMQKKLGGLSEKANVTYNLVQMIIESIHSSRDELKKSVDGLIKKTGLQLQKVTNTTEEATNKILDIAENLDLAQNEIIDMLKRLKKDYVSPDGYDIIEDIKCKIQQNQDSAFTIIDYLQFQDITAQQIAGAYSLLSDTENTLLSVSNMLRNFDNMDEATARSFSYIDKRSFNENAAYTDKSNIQNIIDDMFETGNTEVNIPLEEEPKELRNMPAASSKEEEEDFDIDALFNETKKDKTETSSQDDIDKLFS